LAQYFPPDMGGGATRADNAAKGVIKVLAKVGFEVERQRGRMFLKVAKLLVLVERYK
jgi:hypothetical protein